MNQKRVYLKRRNSCFLQLFGFEAKNRYSSLNKVHSARGYKKLKLPECYDRMSNSKVMTT